MLLQTPAASTHSAKLILVFLLEKALHGRRPPTVSGWAPEEQVEEMGTLNL